MTRKTVFALALMIAFGAQAAAAQPPAQTPSLVRVRYIVNDVPAAVDFYTTKLGFKLQGQAGNNFAALSRGGLQLLLSPTKGTGSASQPMPNGERPAAGGWTRIIIDTNDLAGDVDRLKKQGVRFRNEITSGAGGKEVLVDDPSGNPVELFQAG